MTATLLAAQRVTTQRPRVRLLVRDKQSRFKYIGAQSNADVQAAMCVSADGATIIVVALDASGVIRRRQVTDPTYLDPTGDPGVGWGWYAAAWTQVCTDALGFDHGDIALSNNSGTVRLFYIKADGSELLCRESTDNGVTWSAAATVKALVGASASNYFKLASAGNNDVFWTVNVVGSRRVYFRVKSGGSWGGEVTLTDLIDGGAEYQNCGGISAFWLADLSHYRLAASFWRDDLTSGRVVTCKFDTTRPAGSEVYSMQKIVPPGYATQGFTPLWPVLYRTPSALGARNVLTYTDKFTSGTLSWNSPVCIRSREFDHWSYKIPLEFDVTYDKRFCVCYFNNKLYLYAVNEAYELMKYYSGNAAMEMTEAQGRVLRYRVYERPGSGYLDVELDNRDGRYDDPGVEGKTAAALRPLAQVIIDQGLNTAAGDERVECRPFYLWAVSNVRQEQANWTRIRAVDGWQLFKLWRPDGTYVFENKQLQWCIREIAARVGFFEVSFDASTEWNKAVEYLAVTGEHTDKETGQEYIRAWDRWLAVADLTVAFDRLNGYTMLQRLLDLVGGMARWGSGDSTDVLYCFIPQKQGESPAAVHTYDDGEVLAGQYVKGFCWPTRVRAIGDGVAYEAQDRPNAIAAGMEFLQFLYQENWDTSAECQVGVLGALDDADARAYGGWIRARPNVGLELFDCVTFSDSKAGAGFSGAKRRVNGLLTVFDPIKKVWEQTLYLEQV